MPTGRFIFFDLDVIIQRDLTPIITYNLERPTKMKSWWQDPRPMTTRQFKLAHGAYTNGSCQVWSDDQCECIWNDVLENQKRFGLHTQTEQTIITRGSGVGMVKTCGTTFPRGWHTPTTEVDRGKKMT